LKYWRRKPVVSNYKENYQSNLPRVKYVLTEQEMNALKLIGRTLAREVRKDTPLGPTRKMRKNITYHVIRKTKSVQVGIRSKIFYAAFVELGHRIGNKTTGYLKKAGRSGKKGGTSLGSVPAHPFFMKAIDRNVAAVKKIVMDHLKATERMK